MSTNLLEKMKSANGVMEAASSTPAVRNGNASLPSVNDQMDRIMTIARIAALSGFYDKGASKEEAAAKIAMKILTGIEMGLGEMVSIQGINVIQGKPALGANLIASCLRRHGYDYRVRERTETRCEIEFFSPKGDALGIAAFSEQDAKRAGLLGKDNWKNYPRAMLFSRAMTEGVRAYAPEVLGGIPAYTPEELGDSRFVELPPEEPQAPEAPQAPAPAAPPKRERKAKDPVTETPPAPPVAPSEAPPAQAPYQSILNGFARYGIEEWQLVRRIGKARGSWTAADSRVLIDIGLQLKEGALPSEFFEMPEKPEEGNIFDGNEAGTYPAIREPGEE